METALAIQDHPDDYNDLKRAVALLESPSLTAKLSALVGSPLEGAVKVLPGPLAKRINGAVKAALHTSAEAALWSLDNRPKTAASTRLHTFYAAASGALGGAFGAPALFVELPVSTTLMMRAVADIARSEGFDLTDMATKQACIEVFALGGPNDSDDAAETGYYLTRTFTSRTLQHLSRELVVRQGASVVKNLNPAQAGKWLALLIEKVATRFGVTISSKFAAQAVPVIGALSGATINTLFTRFYQDMARGHFIVKRLEARYGFDEVKQAYTELCQMPVR
ncbi:MULTISPECIES: EcsC family protein [unclassified Pseudomonas]|uniref:EcsC family protein n=1 Tax=unclassified Pseudomonas TaxID=196821 RepID=UPI00190450E4|nr:MULTISPECIES: EcsC family protein [unclassified Pseudomonas]